MKITKLEARKIAKEYSLGKVKKFELIKGGCVNYNYLLTSDKGKYIIRIVGDKSFSGLDHIKLQFKIFEYLQKKKLPYLLPFPLKAGNKRIINVGKNKVWVYNMIRGRGHNTPNESQMKEMARALAIYHKHIQGLKGKFSWDSADKRIEKGFRIMEDIKIKNESDKLVLKYRNFLKDIYDKVSKINRKANLLYLHSDFDSSNVMFDKGKIIGIIDFDDAEYGPRAFDICVSLRDSCNIRGKLDLRKVKIFLKEYEKISKISKEEKELIIPLMLYANVDMFVWAYCFMGKDPENKIKYMKEAIIITEDIVKNKIKL